MVEVLIPAIILTVGVGGAIVAFIVHEHRKEPHVPLVNSFARVPQAPLSAPAFAPHVTENSAPAAANKTTEVTQNKITQSPYDPLPALSEVPSNMPLDVARDLHTVHTFLTSFISPVLMQNRPAFEEALATHAQTQNYVTALTAVTKFFWDDVRTSAESGRIKYADRGRIMELVRRDDEGQDALSSLILSFQESLPPLNSANFPKAAGAALANLITFFNRFVAVCSQIVALIAQAKAETDNSQDWSAKKTAKETPAREDTLPALDAVDQNLSEEVRGALGMIRTVLGKVRQFAIERKTQDVRLLFSLDVLNVHKEELEGILKFFSDAIAALPTEQRARLLPQVSYPAGDGTIGALTREVRAAELGVKTQVTIPLMQEKARLLIFKFNNLAAACANVWRQMGEKRKATGPMLDEDIAARLHEVVGLPDVGSSMEIRNALGTIRNTAEGVYDSLVGKKPKDTVRILDDQQENCRKKIEFLGTFLSAVAVRAGAGEARLQALLVWNSNPIFPTYARGFVPLSQAVIAALTQNKEVAAKANDFIDLCNDVIIYTGRIWPEFAPFAQVVKKPRPDEKEYRAPPPKASDIPQVAPIPAVEQAVRVQLEVLQPKLVAARKAVLAGNLADVRSALGDGKGCVDHLRGVNHLLVNSVHTSGAKREELEHALGMENSKNIVESMADFFERHITLLVSAGTLFDAAAAASQSIKQFNQFVALCAFIDGRLREKTASESTVRVPVSEVPNIAKVGLAPEIIRELQDVRYMFVRVQGDIDGKTPETAIVYLNSADFNPRAHRAHLERVQEYLRGLADTSAPDQNKELLAKVDGDLMIAIERCADAIDGLKVQAQSGNITEVKKGLAVAIPAFGNIQDIIAGVWPSLNRVAVSSGVRPSPPSSPLPILLSPVSTLVFAPANGVFEIADLDQEITAAKVIVDTMVAAAIGVQTRIVGLGKGMENNVLKKAISDSVKRELNTHLGKVFVTLEQRAKKVSDPLKSQLLVLIKGSKGRSLEYYRTFVMMSVNSAYNLLNGETFRVMNAAQKVSGVEDLQKQDRVNEQSVQAQFNGFLGKYLEIRKLVVAAGPALATEQIDVSKQIV
ncbi:MAG TPA: hypothetical protein VJJ82_05040, partial [Candidatus Nanoarchaeia archaeon]|nr:hypothetical protein [Candidatus Nanoarchaeia archaeon]